MSKCNKAKRPCKICLGTVTTRNGLQCQGACQSWVHYSCLNYTPGKIKDIKNGIIRVTCPCPDCKTIMPKEYRTKQPFTCSNHQCPANRPPTCENMKCPINDSERQVAPKPTCPLSTCGTRCKKHSTPQLPYADIPQRPIKPCQPLPPKPKASPTPSDSCFSLNRCSSGCSTSSEPARGDVPGDCGKRPVSGAPSMRAIEDMCNTIGLLTCQLNDLMGKIQNLTSENKDACFNKTVKTQMPPQSSKPGCCCRSKPRREC